MNTAVRAGVATYELLAGGRVRRCLRRTSEHRSLLRDKTDEEIVAACSSLLATPKLTQDTASSQLQAFIGADLGERDAEALALAAEAFSRFPPRGLPRGVQLYDQQLLAATHLVRGALVQMDTGEGKTFALAVAALALLRVHVRVYIVTANRYLAARDAANTAPFWEALGIPVARAIDDGREGSSPWRARVVYTTLEDLVFRSLSEDLGETERLLTWSAVLLDEADAILLEQSTRRFGVIRMTDDPTTDWSKPVEIAKALKPDDMQVGTSLDLSAKLTLAGEARVAALAEVSDQRTVDRLLLFREVELAFVAIRVAREGYDYEVRNGRVLTIDPLTGWHTPAIRQPWVAPLEASRGLATRPHAVYQDFVFAIAVLRRFSHVAGASGTIFGEALDYAMLLALPPALVPPRRPRRDGLLPDVVTNSKDRAHQWIEEEVADQGPTRPILIATDSTVEAQALAQRLRSSKEIQGVRVRVATDETIAAEELFERAGEPGMTIVSTRVAGRGVDIRLSPEAAEAGGAMLLALGHSPEARVDRQLLGRVGREGQPYSARFISYPDDQLMRRVAAKRLERILNSMTEDGSLEAKTFVRVLAGAQRRLRRARLGWFVTDVVMGTTRDEPVAALREWRLKLGTGESGEVPDDFVSFLADRVLASRYPALSFGSKATIATLSAVADGVAEMTNGDRQDALALAGEAAGQTLSESRKVFTGHLEAAVRNAREGNNAARADLERAKSEAERAALRASLHGLARHFEATGGREAPQATLEAALAVSSATSSVPVPEAAVVETLEELNAEASEVVGASLVDVIARRARDPRASDGLGLEGYDPRWATWAGRSSWAIASETIDLAAQQLVSGLERAQFRASQTTSGPGFAAAYRTEVEDLWREVESNLAADVVANLLAGTEPSALDDLFSVREHVVRFEQPEVSVALPVLPAVEASPVPATEVSVPSHSSALIMEYAEAARERLGGDLPDEEALIEGLKVMIDSSELPTLGNPDRVSEAYAVWKRGDERKAKIPPWRWRRGDAYVRGFLAFLHDRGLAAPLPAGLPQRSQSIARRAWRRAASPGVALAFAGLTGAGVLALILGLAPPVSDGFSFKPILQLVDRLLTAGAFSSGSALGPALLALLAGFWARLMLARQASTNSGLLPLEREVGLLVLPIGSLLAVRPWSEGLGLGLIGALALTVLLIAAGWMVCSGVYRFEEITQYRLLALLAAGFAAFSALPLLAELGDATPVLALAGVSALVLVSTAPLRRARIPIVAFRIDDAGMHESEDSVEVLRPVAGQLSVVPHAFALAFAWVTSCAILEAGSVARSLVAAATYLAILIFWAWLLAASVTKVDSWKERMRLDQQTYKPTPLAPTLAIALRQAQRRIVVGELSTVVPLIALATIVALEASPALLRQLPLGLATLCVTVIIVDLSASFLRGLRSPLPAATGAAWDPLAYESSGDAVAVRDLVGRYTKRLGGLFVAVFAVIKLLELVSLGEVAVHVFDWVTSLF